jgi:hypothetical protein
MPLKRPQTAGPQHHTDQELTPSAQGSRSVVRQFLKGLAAAEVAVITLCLAAWPAPCLSADEPQLKHRAPLPENGVTEYRIEPGKRIPVKLLYTLSLRSGEQRGRLYLQTVFPVAVSDHTVIPAGSYIDGKVMDVRRPTHAKDRVELYLRLGRLTLPNGVQRELGACHGSMTVDISAHGSDIVIVPGTTSDIVLQDPIVFPVEQVPNG